MYYRNVDLVIVDIYDVDIDFGVDIVVDIVVDIYADIDIVDVDRQLLEIAIVIEIVSYYMNV